MDIRAAHLRYRKRSPENSKAGAEAYEANLRQKLARGESIDKATHTMPQEQSFGRFSQKWFTEYVLPNNKFSVQRTNKYILDAALVPFFGKIPVSQITAHHIEQYKAQKVKDGKITGKTLKNHLTVLHKCLATAYEWLELGTQPPKIKWPKCAPTRTDYLTPEESELLLSHADGMVYEVILTALRTGMRLGELKGLQWSSIDWQTGSLIVRHARCDFRKVLDTPKSNRERYIPLDSEIYEMLLKRKKSEGYVFTDIDKQPFNTKRLNRRLAAIRKKAGMRKVGWHMLRHTFASHLAMKGVPLPTVQALLGHANITTTMRYAHVAPSTLRTAIDMLNPKRRKYENFGQPVGNQWIAEQEEETAQKSAVPENL